MTDFGYPTNTIIPAYEYYTTFFNNATRADSSTQFDAGIEAEMQSAYAQTGKAGAHPGLGADRGMVSAGT
jgi:hypothetical protein